jgi:hypothetical protein
MEGEFEVETVFVLSGTLATPESSYCEVITTLAIDSTTKIISLPLYPLAGAGGLWTFRSGVIPWHFAAGDTVGVKATSIGGAAPTLGHATYINSFFSLTKIA